MRKMNPYATMAYPFAVDPFALFYRTMPRVPYWMWANDPRCRSGHHHGPHACECGCGEPGKPAAKPNEEPKCPTPADGELDPRMALAQQAKPGKPSCGPRPYKKRFGLMRTDVKETEEAYELIINVPGFKKEDVSVKLKDGYLTICAEQSEEHEEKAEDGAFIRKERYSGSCKRSFYVGEDILEDGIKAKFDEGVLTVNVPKDLKALEEKAPTEIAID